MVDDRARHGRPHVTPLVAVWHGDSVYFCTGEAEQKAVNLRSNQHVALTTGCNGWQEGTDVVVEGVATRVTDDALLADLAAMWATKWDGSWQFEARDGAFHHEYDGEDHPALCSRSPSPKCSASTRKAVRRPATSPHELTTLHGNVRGLVSRPEHRGEDLRVAGVDVHEARDRSDARSADTSAVRCSRPITAAASTASNAPR